jgi:hypothetical protein
MKTAREQRIYNFFCGKSTDKGRKKEREPEREEYDNRSDVSGNSKIGFKRETALVGREMMIERENKLSMGN